MALADPRGLDLILTDPRASLTSASTTVFDTFEQPNIHKSAHLHFERYLRVTAKVTGPESMRTWLHREAALWDMPVGNSVALAHTARRERNFDKGYHVWVFCKWP